MRIAAPRVFVFQCLTAYGEPSPVWQPGMEPELIDRHGRVLTVRFRARSLRRSVTSVERVRLFPPERMLFERLAGGGVEHRAEIALVAVDTGTELRFRGDVTVGTPLLGGLIERTVVAPAFQRAVGRMITRSRITIEAAARASGRTDDA